MKIDVIIEIPKASNIKYEYDSNTKKIKIDRILYGTNIYPANYGFVENTLDYDGDPLDVLIISNQSFLPGCVAPVKVIGGIEMIDENEIDNKLIAVLDCDPRFNSINKLQDLDPHYIKELINFFETYKLLQNKQVKIKGTFDAKKAEEFLNETKKLFLEFNNFLNNPVELKKQMKLKYPKKFS